MKVEVPIGSAEQRTASAAEFTPKNPEDAAKRVVDLIKSGVDPEDAASAAGLAPQALTHNPAIVTAVRRLLTEAAFTAEVQRATLRSVDFANYITLAEKFRNANELDLDVLEALRKQSVMLRADPEIGLTAPPMVGIQIDMAPVKQVLDKLKPAEQEFDFGEEE